MSLPTHRLSLPALTGGFALLLGGAVTALAPAPAASAGVPCEAAYEAGTVYTGGTKTSYAGHNWTARWWTQSEKPSTGGSGVWADNGVCGGPADPPVEQGGFPVSEAQFDQMFPDRNSFYSYAGLIDAVGKFPAFAGTGSDTVRKQELAAFLANANHETGGLVYITEINKGNDLCDESQPYGCPAGTYGYYGRGPIQLSWNFNYKAAGDYLGLDLLGNPFLVEQQSSVAWQTALWYWMTQSGPGTMTPHAAMVNSAGFGQTIRSINGSLECDGRNPAQVQSRVDAYSRFTGIIGVTPGGNLSC